MGGQETVFVALAIMVTRLLAVVAIAVVVVVVRSALLCMLTSLGMLSTTYVCKVVG